MTEYVRFRRGDTHGYGQLTGTQVRLLGADLFDSPKPTGGTFALDEVTLLPPVDPAEVRSVTGVANNYHNPAAEPRLAPHPRFFSKLPSAIGVHQAEIELPVGGDNLNYEGELVAVIGRAGFRIPLTEAQDYIFGYTIGNDWSENTWYVEKNGWNQPSRVISKAIDGWVALYPVIFTDIDPAGRRLEVRIDGTPVAGGSTDDMVNTPAQLVHYLSHFVPLTPGDLIFTGTVNPPAFPGDRRVVYDGETVEVEIEGLGTLANTVRTHAPGAAPLAHVLSGRALA
jgi:2-keto-4-pentenoate hydratase/2-oxohepta-3-ene-1,7-dioic acid hydratase in catechol pathway